MRNLLIAVIFTPLLALSQSIPLNEAADVFSVARQVNAYDNSQLWGEPVCGPILLVDTDTFQIVTNQADQQGQLKASGDVWTGTLPRSISPANTAMDFAGVHWTMLMWPVTRDPRDRPRLVAHECFHRIQPDLKLVSHDVTNSHLDTQDGRTWLELEWRALERSLVTSGDERKKAVADALLFRNYRRMLIPKAAAGENALEMNEGLAEYTGYRLAFPNESDRRAAAAANLHNGTDKPSYGRSFAYVSGPAYGILLDATGTNWRKSLKPDSDFGVLLAQAYNIKSAADKNSAMDAAKNYMGDSLMAYEAGRAKRMEARRADIRKRFVDGPVLVLPIDKEFGYSFDPNDIISLDDNSTLYRNSRVTGSWGVLEAEGGALMTRENGKVVRVTVPAAADPNAAQPSNDGWKLTLKPGWKIIPGPRSGDQTLTRQ